MKTLRQLFGSVLLCLLLAAAASAGESQAAPYAPPPPPPPDGVALQSNVDVDVYCLDVFDILLITFDIAVW